MTTTVTITFTDATDTATWQNALDLLNFYARPSGKNTLLSETYRRGYSGEGPCQLPGGEDEDEDYGGRTVPSGLSVQTAVDIVPKMPQNNGAVIQSKRGRLYMRTETRWFTAEPGTYRTYSDNDVVAVLRDGGRVLFDGIQE